VEARPDLSACASEVRTVTPPAGPAPLDPDSKATAAPEAGPAKGSRSATGPAWAPTPAGEPTSAAVAFAVLPSASADGGSPAAPEEAGDTAGAVALTGIPAVAPARAWAPAAAGEVLVLSPAGTTGAAAAGLLCPALRARTTTDGCPRV